MSDSGLHSNKSILTAIESNTRIDRLLLDHGMDHEISWSGDIISTILEQSVSPDVALHISYYYIIINVQAIPKF